MFECCGEGQGGVFSSASFYGFLPYGFVLGRREGGRRLSFAMVMSEEVFHGNLTGGCAGLSIL